MAPGAYSRDARLLLDTLCLTDRDSQEISHLSARWAAADALNVVQVMVAEGAAVWLRRRLKAMGVTLPPDAAAELETAAKRGIAQAMRAELAARDAIATLAAAGIPVVAIKGIALRGLAKRIPYSDARSMSDVDLLIPATSTDAAWRAMVDAGYTHPTKWVPAHHLPSLFGPAGVAIELHFALSPGMDPGESWRRATDADASAMLDGMPVRVPCDTELLWHAASHVMRHIEQEGASTIRLKGWLDAAAILAADVPIDWPTIAARLAGEAPAASHALQWLEVAAWLAGRSLPSDVSSGAGWALNIERLLSWRLRHAKAGAPNRWVAKLIEEGARGELRLPVQPASRGASAVVRARHGAAVRAARAWWWLRR